VPERGSVTAAIFAFGVVFGAVTTTIGPLVGIIAIMLSVGTVIGAAAYTPHSRRRGGYDV
jgi:hypothetical protein